MPQGANFNPRVDLRALAIGQRIVQSRNRKGWTQARLAFEVGVTVGAIAQYETGRNKPSLMRLERLAKVLEVSPEWLLAGDDQDLLSQARTGQEEYVLRLFRHLTPAQQETVLTMLAGLAQENIAKKSG